MFLDNHNVVIAFEDNTESEIDLSQLLSGSALFNKIKSSQESRPREPETNTRFAPLNDFPVMQMDNAEFKDSFSDDSHQRGRKDDPDIDGLDIYQNVDPKQNVKSNNEIDFNRFENPGKIEEDRSDLENENYLNDLFSKTATTSRGGKEMSNKDSSIPLFRSTGLDDEKDSLLDNFLGVRENKNKDENTEWEFDDSNRKKPSQLSKKQIIFSNPDEDNSLFLNENQSYNDSLLNSQIKTEENLGNVGSENSKRPFHENTHLRSKRLKKIFSKNEYSNRKDSVKMNFMNDDNIYQDENENNEKDDKNDKENGSSEIKKTNFLKQNDTKTDEEKRSNLDIQFPLENTDLKFLKQFIQNEIKKQITANSHNILNNSTTKRENKRFKRMKTRKLPSAINLFPAANDMWEKIKGLNKNTLEALLMPYKKLSKRRRRRKRYIVDTGQAHHSLLEHLHNLADRKRKMKRQHDILQSQMEDQENLTRDQLLRMLHGLKQTEDVPYITNMLYPMMDPPPYKQSFASGGHRVDLMIDKPKPVIPIVQPGAVHLPILPTGVASVPIVHPGLGNLPIVHPSIAHEPIVHPGVAHVPIVHPGLRHVPIVHPSVTHVVHPGVAPMLNSDIIHTIGPEIHTGDVHVPITHTSSVLPVSLSKRVKKVTIAIRIE